MKRYLYRIAATLALLLVIIVLSAQWFWNSPHTLSRAMAFAEKRWPQLQIDSVTGNLNQGIEVSRLRWQAHPRSIEINKLNIKPDWECVWYFTLCLKELSIDTLAITREDSNSQAESADTPTILPSLFLPLPVDIDKLTINSINLTAFDIDEPISKLLFRGAWSGSSLEIQKLSFSYLNWQQRSSGNIKLTEQYPLTLKTDIFKIQDIEPLKKRFATLKSKGNLSDLQVDITTNKELSLALSINTNLLHSSLPWQLQGRYLSDFNYQHAETDHQISLKNTAFSAKGENLQGRVQLHANLESNLVKGRQKLSADLLVNRETLRIEKLQLQLPEQSDITLSGNIPLRLPVTAKLHIDWQNLKVNDFFSQLPEKTVISGSAKTDILWDNSLKTFDIQTLNSSGHYGEYPINLDAEMQWHADSLLTISKWQMALGENRIELTNTWHNNSIAKWHIELNQLSQLHNQLQGRISGVFQHHSLDPRQYDEVSLTAENLIYNDIQVKRVNLSGKQTSDGQQKIKAQLSNIDFNSVTWDTIELSAQGNWHNASLLIDARSEELMDIHAECDAKFEQQTPPSAMSAHLFCNDGSILPNSKWKQSAWHLSQPLDIQWSPEENNSIAIKPFCLSSSGSDICQLSDMLITTDQTHFDLAIRNIPMQMINPWLGPGLSLEGTFNGSLQGSYTNQALLYQGKLKSSDITLNIKTGAAPLTFLFREPTFIASSSYDGISIKFETRTDQNTKIRSDISIDRSRQLSGRVNLASFPISTLTPLLEEFKMLQGELNGDLKISGNLDQPYFQGNISISDGRAEIIGLPWILEKTTLNILLDGNRLSYSGDAKVDQGDIAVTGELNWHKEGSSGTMHVTGNEIHYQPIVRTNVWLKPDLTLAWQQENLDIQGSVFVSRAFVVMDKLPKNTVNISEDSIVVDGQSSQVQPWDIHANISLVLGEVVKFRGFGLETLLAGQMNISHSPQSPWQGRGIIHLHEGSYKAYGQNLQIRTGDLIFTGSLMNPVIRIDAIRPDIEPPTIVGVRAEGLLNDATVTIFSSPAMAEQRALHFLLTGKRPDDNSTSSEALAGQALLSYGLSKSEGYAASTANRLGIYDFQMTATDGESGPKVQMGGYISPRLHVSYGIGTFDGTNELTLRYRLRSNLFVEAVSSAVNALDLLWSFRVNK